MSLSALIAWFAAASFAGWVFESLHNVAVLGHWEKRGFLFGPICPIYGVGTAAAFLLFDRPEVAGGAWPVWAVFLVCMAGSAVMEYVVSYVLERLFGAVWWDYSNLPLNLNGRICLPASLLFGTAGTLLAYFGVPFAHVVNALVPPLAFEVFALAFAFALGADVATTVLSLSDLMERVTQLDHDLNLRADEHVQNAGEALRAIPDQWQAGRARTMERVRQGGDRAAARLRDGTASAADRMQGLIGAQQERLRQTAEHLTARQVGLLRQMRRLPSPRVRESVDELRRVLRETGRRGGKR